MKPAAEDGAGGRGANGRARYSPRHNSLGALIQIAHGTRTDQAAGGPAWVSSDLWDVEAETEKPATDAENRQMLQTLPTERLGLVFHRTTKAGAVYAMISLHAANESDPRPRIEGGVYAGRVEMKMLARIIEIYLKRAFPGAAQADPADPPPVIDETGLGGLYDVRIDPRQSGDWLTAIEGQLGLKLERRKSPVAVLVIDRAERPAGN